MPSPEKESPPPLSSLKSKSPAKKVNWNLILDDDNEKTESKPVKPSAPLMYRENSDSYSVESYISDQDKTIKALDLKFGTTDTEKEDPKVKLSADNKRVTEVDEDADSDKEKDMSSKKN